jgi:hypothetical protein
MKWKNSTTLNNWTLQLCGVKSSQNINGLKIVVSNVNDINLQQWQSYFLNVYKIGYVGHAFLCRSALT